MRTTVLSLVKALTASVSFPEPIYEFGAHPVVGQQHRGKVRDYFSGKMFVGCDLLPGPGVDQIQDLHQLSLQDGTIGTALLFDTIEHVREPWRAMAELYRCLRPGGIVVMTSHMYFPIHNYPDDYWRFTASAFRVLLRSFDSLVVEAYGLRKLPHTVLGIASKGRIAPATELAIGECVHAWRRRGSSSWKEVGLAVLPPCLLIPAYDLLMLTLRVVHPAARKDRGESGGKVGS